MASSPAHPGLFLHALCNGWIGPDKPVIEAFMRTGRFS